ncbi:cation diffusion facilitator family transporter [Deferrisoma palaeochoriense]
MSHDHSHSAVSGRRLGIAIALNLLITLAEAVGGIASGSLSLLSDALHNLSDGVSLGVSWIALRLAARQKSHRYTFGLKRAQVLAAALNSGALVAICLYLFWEAYQRLLAPRLVDAGLMIAVASVGLAANLAGTLLLREGAKANLNVRSSYLHLLSDAFSSAAVIGGGVAMAFWGVWWVDPVLTVLIGLYVLKESVALVVEATRVLLLAAPEDISLSEIRLALEEFPEVRNVHHVHLWRVDDSDTHFEGHVDLEEDMPVSRAAGLLDRIERVLHERYGINHTTVQLERDRCGDKRLVGPAPGSAGSTSWCGR